MNRHISTFTGVVILVLILCALGIAIWARLPNVEDATETELTNKMPLTGSEADISPWNQPNFEETDSWIEVTAPNGGESYFVNTEYGGFWEMAVSWKFLNERDSLPASVLVTLYRESGNPVYEYCDVGHCGPLGALSSEFNAAAGMAIIDKIPGNIISANDYRIRLELLAAGGNITVAEDISDANFTITNLIQH